jgi:SAM-dependent methyltransferase
MSVTRYFDQVYEHFPRYWWRTSRRYSTDPADHPTSLVTQQLLRLLSGRRGGHALDLGAGEGADAIRLALMGYRVDAVEISPVGARKMRLFAEEAGVSLRIWNTDARLFEPVHAYDVIICNGLLHYVEDKATIVRRMQAATVPGGLNAISLWSSFTPVPEPHRSVEVHCDNEHGVVVGLYAGWHFELLYFERDKLEMSHPGLEPHRHSYIKLITRKSKASSGPKATAEPRPT